MRKEKMSNEFTKYHLGIKESPVPFVLHKFTGVDRDTAHDHPFSFQTHILYGGYLEEVYTIHPDGTWSMQVVEHSPGTSHRVEATHIHRIIGLPAGECWTMIIPEPAVRETRFWKFGEDGIYSRHWRRRTFDPYKV